MIQGINTAVFWVFALVGVAAFAVELWALVVAVRAPAAAYLASGRQSKVLWVCLTGVAAMVGFGSLPLVGTGRSFGSLLTIAAVVLAGFFLASVRPAVAGYRRRPPRQSPGGW